MIESIVGIRYKTCGKCISALPSTLEFYYRDRKTNDSLTCLCKKCFIEDQMDKVKNFPYPGVSKQCSGCHRFFPATLEFFNLRNSGKFGLCEKCRDCKSEESKFYYKNNPVARRQYHLLNKYGLTQSDYQIIFDRQGGNCAICGINQSNLSKPLFIDHNHLTGQRRGLLCNPCNIMVGMAKDNYSILMRAAEYLKAQDIT